MDKILISCHAFYPENTGYGNAFLNLIKAILKYKKNIKIDVVTSCELGNSEELEIENLRIIRLNKFTNIRNLRAIINPIYYALKINKLFKQNNYSMLLVETFHMILTYLNREVLKKTLVRIHGISETEATYFYKSFPHKVSKLFLKFMIGKVKYIASTNPYHIQFAKTYYFSENVYKISEKVFTVIPNTFDNSYILTKNVRNNNNPLIEKLKFISLGSMEETKYPQKGLEDLLNALILLKDQNGNLNAKLELVIIGKGIYREKLVRKAKLNDLDFIKFLESTTHDETLNLLNDSDVSVLPSRFEGMSMFALESIATKNLVLFSRTGGLIPLVKDNGFLVEPQNIEDLCEKIRLVIDFDRNEIEKMKENSLKLFNEKFSEKIVAEKFIKILNIIKSDNIAEYVSENGTHTPLCH